MVLPKEKGDTLCGCGKRNVMPRAALRPSVGPRAIQGGTAAGPSPAAVRAVALQKSVSLQETRRMDNQRLKLEAMRRAAIAKRLGK